MKVNVSGGRGGERNHISSQRVQSYRYIALLSTETTRVIRRHVRQIRPRKSVAYYSILTVGALTSCNIVKQLIDEICKEINKVYKNLSIKRLIKNIVMLILLDSNNKYIYTFTMHSVIPCFFSLSTFYFLYDSLIKMKKQFHLHILAVNVPLSVDYFIITVFFFSRVYRLLFYRSSFLLSSFTWFCRKT